MVSNRLGLAVIGLASVVAAGVGGFVAMRQTDQPAIAASAPAQASTAPAPVQETEAPVAESSAPVPPAATPTVEASAPPVAAPSPQVTVAPPTAPTPSKARADKPKPTARSVRPTPPTPTLPSATPGDTRVASDPAPEPVSTSRTEPQSSDVQTPPPAAPDTASHQEPSPAEPQHQLEDVIVPADSVIGLQIETSVSSETARVEDRVDARVTRDVTVNGRVAIPAGARLRGAVTLVDRGGKVKDRSRLGVRFHTLVLADGTTMTIQTDAVYREGDSPAQASAAKIGGAAIGGAILGAIMGGARGAVIGGSTGAAGGTAAVMAGSRKPAALPAGTSVTVRVLSPVTVTVEN
jgi:hypothetical protein